MNNRTHEYTMLLKKTIEDLQTARDDYYTTDWPEHSTEEKEVFMRMSLLFKEVALLKALIAEKTNPKKETEEVSQ